MSAASADYFIKVRQNFSTTIGAGGVAGADTTTIPLSSVENLPTDTAIELVINRVDTAGTDTNNYETVRGVISGSNLTNVVRGVEGTAQAWDAGVVVEYLITADIQNRLVTGILVEHSQSGIHTGFAKLGSIQTFTANQAFSQTALFTSGFTVNQSAIFNSSVLLGGGFIANQSAIFSSAMYTQQVSPRVIEIQVFDPATAHTTGDGKAFMYAPSDLNGMNLTSVISALSVVGTGSTTLTQIRRKRAGSDVDMLSTRVSIDAAEYDSTTAAAPAVIATANMGILTGDQVYIDHDQNHTTAGSGLVVYLKFSLP